MTHKRLVLVTAICLLLSCTCNASATKEERAAARKARLAAAKEARKSERTNRETTRLRKEGARKLERTNRETTRLRKEEARNKKTATNKGDRKLRREISRMEKEKIKDTKEAMLDAARSTSMTKADGRAVRREAREQMQELSQRNWDQRKSRTQMGQSPTLTGSNVKKSSYNDNGAWED